MAPTSSDPRSGPVSFTLGWLGVAVVVLAVVGVVVGLIRDDVAGTLGPVVGIGLMVTAIALVAALALRDHR
ncbi:hypothetical protein [Nocardioides flavescens]|uniref:Uncharacterized protein n=1 Tax=Nocardioides flavescens TaxID=2691959 RepID=A0A6L7F1K8_9ACTN|nr:hypothetical protein [Nocardioides flavescens]MXG91139.1 hypothetical protein [Nocardioides flavescens]